MKFNLIARPGFMLRIAAVLAVLAGALAARPAAAQIGAIFGDSPPRPPADVPERAFPPQPPPVQYPGPAPLPSPSPGSSIQSQPLPPPPGASLAPKQAPSQAIKPQNLPAAQQPRPGTPPPAVQPANPPPPQPADTSPQPDDTVITEMPSQKIENARAVFSGLDKITGRIISFDAAIGETVQFGALRVTARVCYTRPPTEATNTDAFVQVDEVTLQGEVKRIFSGWMFAASPGLHAVEHPIYDVWLTDCASPIKVAEPVAPPAPAPAARSSSARTRQPASTRQQNAAPPGSSAH
ncbi:MAG TPA: DUF2155 domain-containing protein [Xanthobacteraceae bacterium]|nr:DUF2155 domain-containing protein [Xanthobacteraceae bacterium]